MKTSVHQNVHVGEEDSVAVDVKNFDGPHPFVSVSIEVGMDSFSFFIAPDMVRDWERKMQILANELYALGCALDGES